MAPLQDAFKIIGGEHGEPSRSIEFELRGAGRRFPIFFRSPEPVLTASHEAFLASALLPAMATGVGLDLPGEVSERVLSSLPRVQDVYTTWERQLERVSLSGLVPVAKERAPTGRVATFFSSGVDSFYSLIKHREEITDLIFVRGFDIPYEEAGRFRPAHAGIEETAAEFGVGVVHVWTNLKDALDTLVHWGILGHGVALMAVGHLLASLFDRIYIPSTGSYAQLSPWGSSPLLDPLWSTESLEFVHDGCEANRIRKTEHIAASDTVLRYLRVCYSTRDGEYNCGRCEKCVRTMINLEIAGKLAQCHTFHGPLTARRIRRLRVPKRKRGYLVENLEELRRRKLRPDLQRAIRYVLLRPSWTDVRAALPRPRLPKRLWRRRSREEAEVKTTAG